MDRRKFFKSVAGAGLASAAVTAAAGFGGCKQKTVKKSKKAVLKLGSQEGRIPGKNLAEKVATLEKWGGSAIEPGGRGLPGRVKDIKKALAGTNIKVSAICAGYEGALISSDPAEREKAVASMSEILKAAGELESTGLIIVPAFLSQKPMENKTARPMLIDLLVKLGDVAKASGTRILMEPLNRGETFFLRQLADAAAICRDVNHPAVAMMGDFYHMNIEETSDLGAFLSGGEYVHHVHLASAKRNLPGQDERSFVEGFRGLKIIGYQDYCSLECRIKGDPMVEIPKSFDFLREQWKQAII